MKARVLFTAMAALALIAACKPDPKPTGDTFKATLGVTGITGNTISVSADAKDVTFTVSANISWAITNTANWITVEPASATIEDKQTAETTVTVKVAANEDEAAREATLSVGADGVDAVTVTVKQAGVEKPQVILQAFDVENFEPIADPALTVAGLNGVATITIQANANWAATAPEWLTVDPAEFTYDGENDLASVSVKAASATEAREGEIKFAAEGAELTVKVSQTAAPTISIEGAEVDYPYSQIAFTITPATDEEYYNYIYASKATYDNMGEQGLVDYMLNRANGYLSSYSAATIIASLFYQGAGTYTVNDLDAETAYAVVTVGIAYDEAAGVFVQSTLGATYEVTTTAAPTASEAYLALIGSYKGTVYNYFEDANAEMTMVVEPFGINETYLVGFPDGIINPVSNSGKYDRFTAYLDEETGDLVFPAVSPSDLGAYWGYKIPDYDGYCQILLVGFYYLDEELELESYGFHLSEDKNTLSAFAVPEIPEEDYLLFGGNIAKEDGSSTGYAAGYAVVLSDFTRVEDEAEALSVKSGIVCPSEKNFKAIKAAGKARK